MKFVPIAGYSLFKNCFFNSEQRFNYNYNFYYIFNISINKKSDSEIITKILCIHNICHNQQNLLIYLIIGANRGTGGIL